MTFGQLGDWTTQLPRDLVAAPWRYACSRGHTSLGLYGGGVCSLAHGEKKLLIAGRIGLGTCNRLWPTADSAPGQRFYTLRLKPVVPLGTAML